MNITVILCTFDGGQSLFKALDSIAVSALPESIEWEVVVVDNNSQDQTRAVVEEFCRRKPARFRYLFERRPGKSYALNTGILAARGDILAFTDDDVTVEHTWLHNLTAPLEDSNWVGVAGRTVLQLPSSAPKWLLINDSYARSGFPARPAFPAFDRGPEARELTYPPYGTNVAFRKSAFEQYGAFRTDLGPSPGDESPRAGEDTEFGGRLLFAGKHIRYEPSAVVYHPVPKAKINKKFLLSWHFNNGRAVARELRIGPGHLVGSLAVRALRWMTSTQPSTRFCYKAAVWERVGTVIEWRRQSQAAKQARILKAEVLRRDGACDLDLKAGEWVEVRTKEEILVTLDENGRLGNLPFMPEMLPYCGKQFRVYKRADKTCDNIEPWSIRRVTNSVHLEGVRCDGEGHAGCQALCLIFWKEAWLKRATQNVVSANNLAPNRSSEPKEGELYSVERILDASSRKDWKGETLYSCQATELLNFTSTMRSWDPRQYIRDLRSGNLAQGLAGDLRSHRGLEVILGVLEVLRAVTISLFNTVQEKRHFRPVYPFIEGVADKTPREVLNLQPGELVQVRSKEEIMATLDKKNRNRGLSFDGATLTYCGGIYRVLRRVSRIVDEKTGKILDLKNPCIVLDGVICRWDYHRFCPKASYPYWRENWLKRAADIPTAVPVGQIGDTCDKS